MSQMPLADVAGGIVWKMTMQGTSHFGKSETLSTTIVYRAPF